jgi:hypothetical protein
VGGAVLCEPPCVTKIPEAGVRGAGQTAQSGPCADFLKGLDSSLVQVSGEGPRGTQRAGSGRCRERGKFERGTGADLGREGPYRAAGPSPVQSSAVPCRLLQGRRRK